MAKDSRPTDEARRQWIRERLEVYAERTACPSIEERLARQPIRRARLFRVMGEALSLWGLAQRVGDPGHVLRLLDRIERPDEVSQLAAARDLAAVVEAHPDLTRRVDAAIGGVGLGALVRDLGGVAPILQVVSRAQALPARIRAVARDVHYRDRAQAQLSAEQSAELRKLLTDHEPGTERAVSTRERVEEALVGYFASGPVEQRLVMSIRELATAVGASRSTVQRALSEPSGEVLRGLSAQRRVLRARGRTSG